MSVLLFWEIVAVVVLVAVAGFAACADAALSRVSRVRAAELVEEGVPRAGATLAELYAERGEIRTVRERPQATASGLYL